MQIQRVVQVLVVASGLAWSASTLLAQPAQSVRSEIEILKKELASLQLAAANAPTLAQSLQDLSSKLVVLEQELANSQRTVQNIPELVEQLDGLQLAVAALEKEVGRLQTELSSLEQPAVLSGGGAGNAHQVGRGMRLSTEDGLYSLSLGGYLQTRYQARLPEDMSTVDEAGFQLRRARVTMKGQAGSERLHYGLGIELAAGTVPLLDYYMDMKYSSQLTVRVGQAKVPYSRSFLTSSKSRTFHELSKTQNLQRYDRDIGVWGLGKLADGRLRYHLGLSNGSGKNARNDNIDLVAAMRIEGVVLGAYIPPSSGDVEGRSEAALTLGASIVHDLVRVPEALAGIEVGNVDVDGDGTDDNVRVVSAAFDAQFRFKGLDLSLETTWRRESWGTIVAHTDNAALADAVDASASGNRNYLGVTAEASYFVLPGRLSVGGRLSHGRLPLLGLAGRGLTAESAPLAQRALQFDAIAQLYRDGFRRVGVSYSLLNYNALDGADPAGDIGHTLVFEAQLLL